MSKILRELLERKIGGKKSKIGSGLKISPLTQPQDSNHRPPDV